MVADVRPDVTEQMLRGLGARPECVGRLDVDGAMPTPRGWGVATTTDGDTVLRVPVGTVVWRVHGGPQCEMLLAAAGRQWWAFWRLVDACPLECAPVSCPVDAARAFLADVGETRQHNSAPRRPGWVADDVPGAITSKGRVWPGGGW